MTTSASVFSTRRRVLVVEDDRDFAESLVDLLEPQGFEVATAKNAAQALERLADFSADVALIDVRLGSDDGIQLVSALRSRRKNLVCVLMTAYAELNSAVNAVRAGAEDYLMKPLEPAALSGRLRRAIDEEAYRTRKEREQRLLTIGSVCTGIAHDINNCLQVMLYEIDGMESNLLSSPPDTQSATTAVHSLANTVGTAAAICQRIMEFAKGAPSSGCSDLVGVLNDTQPLLERLNRSQTTVKVAVNAPEKGLWVQLGATELEQVIVNLVLNACHAVSGDGHVQVALTGRLIGDKRMVQLEVTDNGRGIPADVLPRIFDPYFSTKSTGEGTGLGLSIVYGLVHSVTGGEVRVESELGLGSCFTVLLPERPTPN